MPPIAAVCMSAAPEAGALLDALAGCPLVGARAALLPPAVAAPRSELEPIHCARPDSSQAVAAVLRWFETSDADHLLWAASPWPDPVPGALKRLWTAALDSAAALAYGDRIEADGDGRLRQHPLIDYQPGSLRDDFDFGPLLLMHRAALAGLSTALAEREPPLEHAGAYELRLRLSERGPVLHLPEPLCTLPTADARPSGQRVFDYVDPRDRQRQLELERVATEHLARIGAHLPPPAEPPAPEHQPAPCTASVVIPVKDRSRTIAEAVDSALAQRADFSFNVIAVDNHSSDGTTDILATRAEGDPRLLHLVPARRDLGIGGCWNAAVFHPACGRYAVQLDSDDLYAGENTLARLVAEFQRAPAAMVIGAYTTVDFDLQPLPPGLVDHREWTPDNGHNNALRIHGLGAPRAFHTASLRRIGFPNVSYGEDYAVALQLSRRHRIGRIYEPLYRCRRWPGNSDADLELAVHNRYQSYKDRLRSIEIAARQRLVAARG